MSSGTLLEVDDLHVHLGHSQPPIRAVDGVSFSVQRGEIFALLGESGCGKSITALSILRLLPAGGRCLSGAIRFGGIDLLHLPEASMCDVRGRRIAMIFQEPQTSLNPVLNIGAQVGEVLRRHLGLRGKANRQRTVELLDAVGIPEPARCVDEYPHRLSGGMKQRVMIAMALAGEPELLIADEPTTALDMTIQAQVLELLRDLRQRTGMAILFITHDLGVVAEVADRIGVMYAGQIVEEARRDQFLAAPMHPYTRKLFESTPNGRARGLPLAVIQGTVPTLAQSFSGCRFDSRCEQRLPACSAKPPQWTSLAAQQFVRCHLYSSTEVVRTAAASGGLGTGEADQGSPAASAQSRSAALEVSGLSVHFPIERGVLRRTTGYVYAVDGVSLSVAPATTLALVGESGCGKTTVAKAILRLIDAGTGDIHFNRMDLRALSADALRRTRRDIQIIFQDPGASMNPLMNVGDIIAEGLVAQGIGTGREERYRRVERLLEQVGLDPSARNRYPHQFSGGQRQRICIARALAVEPKLIVCDEPTSALDVSVQAQILNLLKSLQQQLGLSYLLITHNLGVVEYLAHEVAVMYLGRIVEQGRAEEVLREPRHPYTQALLSAVPEVHRRSDRERIRLAGEFPSPAAPPAGCHFHPRCPHAETRCRIHYPDDRALSATHTARCHLLA